MSRKSEKEQAAKDRAALLSLSEMYHSKSFSHFRQRDRDIIQLLQIAGYLRMELDGKVYAIHLTPRPLY